MNAEQLSKVGSDLVRRCGTRDPFQIAKELGIIVLDDCENFGRLKGMYRVIKKNRFIFLNKDGQIVYQKYIGADKNNSSGKAEVAPHACKRRRTAGICALPNEFYPRI